MRAVTSASIESGVAAPRVMPVRTSSRRNSGLVMPRFEEVVEIVVVEVFVGGDGGAGEFLRLGRIQRPDVDRDCLVCSIGEGRVVLPPQRR